jgi:hypothetical protein
MVTPLPPPAADQPAWQVGPAELRRAVAAGLLRADQLYGLERFFASHANAVAAVDPAPRFDLVHLLWYAGALIVIAGLGLFSSLAFVQMGGAALAATAAAYALLFTGLGAILWRRGLSTPGGLALTVAVTMAPLLTFGIQDHLGAWHAGEPGTYQDFYRWIKASWLPMEVATIAAGALAFWFCRMPFLLMPVGVALWFMSMDLTPWLFGAHWDSWAMRALVSLRFGLAVLALAWWVDVRAGGGHAFWLHLFGLLAFWGGLTSMESDSEIGAGLYALINVGLLGLALFLQRRAYAVFGTLGIAAYLHHLASEVFRDSLLYPFALSLLGLAVLGAGLWYHRHQAAIAAALQRLPAGLQALRPAHAR